MINRCLVVSVSCITVSRASVIDSKSGADEVLDGDWVGSADMLTDSPRSVSDLESLSSHPIPGNVNPEKPVEPPSWARSLLGNSFVGRLLLRVGDGVRNHSFLIPKHLPDRGIWLLGQQYLHDYGEFVDAFKSLVAFTYRKDFAELDARKNFHVRKSLYQRATLPTIVNTSDAGWGCVVRAMQMLLAECFISRIHGNRRRSTPRDDQVIDVISKFRDVEADAPLSIQNFVKAGERPIGAWYGFWEAGEIFSELIKASTSSLYRMGCILSTKLERKAVVVKNLSSNAGGLIMLVKLNLGQAPLNLQQYKSALLQLFSIEYFRGFAGAWYSEACYFVGASEDYLYLLDPHVEVQSALTDGASGVNQESVRAIHWESLNGDMVLGFVVKSEVEYDRLLSSIAAIDGHENLEVLRRS